MEKLFLYNDFSKLENVLMLDSIKCPDILRGYICDDLTINLFRNGMECDSGCDLSELAECYELKKAWTFADDSLVSFRTFLG